MNQILLFLLGIIILSCATEESRDSVENENAVVEQPSTSHLPFRLLFEMEEAESKHRLIAYLELDSSNYIISPYSNDSIYGPFEISLEENDVLILSDSLIEHPASIEEFDPVIEKQVRFIRANTTFEWPLSIQTKSDFEVDGLIWFVLEPDCVPYETTFTIIQESGERTVLNVNSKISDAYKR